MLYNKTETIKEWNPYIALSCMSTGTFTYYKRDFLTCYFHSKRYIYSHWSFSSSVTNSVLITSCGYCGCRHKKTIKEYNPLLYIMKYEHRTQVLCFVCRVFNCITHIKSIDINTQTDVVLSDVNVYYVLYMFFTRYQNIINPKWPIILPNVFGMNLLLFIVNRKCYTHSGHKYYYKWWK